MPAWLDKLRGAADNPDTAVYKSIRAASKTWFDKIIQHPASKPFDIVKAAKKLALSVQDRTVVFEDENEQAMLMDFYLLDYRPDGKSVAESCLFASGELTPVEAEWHQAFLASRTSLFEIAAVHNHEPKILLRDRLNQTASELWLTDLGLSDSFRRIGAKALLFTRVVSLRGLHITGGFSFVFDPKHESQLVDGYRWEMWSVRQSRQDCRRTGFFLGLNRKFGLAQEHADVVPPAGSGGAA